MEELSFDKLQGTSNARQQYSGALFYVQRLGEQGFFVLELRCEHNERLSPSVQLGIEYGILPSLNQVCL